LANIGRDGTYYFDFRVLFHMNIIKRPLPQFCYSNRTRPIEGLVIHYISCIYADMPDTWKEKHWNDIEQVWRLLHDMNCEPEQRKYGIYQGPRLYGSYDWLISGMGEIWESVPYGYRSWHAGESQWKGRTGCNDFMAGIALISAPQHVDDRINTLGHDEISMERRKYGFTDAHYMALEHLCRREMKRNDFGLDMITGHDKVAPDRKRDPGHTFDYTRLFSRLKPAYDLNGG